MSDLREATRFPHTRLSLARLFALLAIHCAPRSEWQAISLLFCAHDTLKARRDALRALKAQGGRSDG